MPYPHMMTAFAGLVFLLVTIAFAAEDVSMFINLPGFLIVIGGSLAALAASYPLRQLKDALQQIGQLKSPNKPDMQQEIEQLVLFSRLWFRHQYQQIDLELEKLKDPFTRHGLQMVRDQQALEDVLTYLNWRIAQYRSKAAERIKPIQSLATFAPAFGMIGTVIGLANMLNGIHQNELAALTSDMVLALSATLYGLILANLVFKPMAAKLEQIRQEETTRLGVLAEGIALIAQGRTPGLIQDTLSHLIHEPQVKADQPPEPVTIQNSKSRA